MYSYSQPGQVWNTLYSGVANPAAAAGNTVGQYGNNLQQYYAANMGVLQPSLNALIQQQYKGMGHGRSPLANQNASLQMMQMAYQPAVSSAGNYENYIRQLLAQAASTAMQYPRQDYAGSSGGGGTNYLPDMGGEYRNNTGFGKSEDKDTKSQDKKQRTEITDSEARSQERNNFRFNSNSGNWELIPSWGISPTGGGGNVVYGGYSNVPGGSTTTSGPGSSNPTYAYENGSWTEIKNPSALSGNMLKDYNSLNSASFP
jgi:hypothetical protein